MNRTFFTVIFIGMFSSVSLGYSGGSGMPENPYKIADVNDLLQLAATAADYNKCFIMNADINLADYNCNQFSLIGNGAIVCNLGGECSFVGTPFSGAFDGNGFIISNFNYNCAEPNFIECIGFFGAVDGAEIKNLTLVTPNIYVENGDRVGSLVGYIISGTIIDCQVEGGSVTGVYRTGGLVGQSGEDILISNCYTNTAISGHAEIGGLIGSTYYGNISNCCSTGSVTATSSVTLSGYFVGGLIGANYYGTISNCYATGDVSVAGLGVDVGGLVGESRGLISNSYATGNVTSEDGSKIGGLVGINSGPISNSYSTGNVTLETGSYIGGLVGCNYNKSSIWNCYAAGNVSAGGSDIGGLVGLNYGTGTVTTSFWDIEASGQASSSGGTGLNTAQMKQQASFIGWDFTTPVWTIEENIDYPHLWWEENILYVPGRYPTIQSAIDAAVNGDTVIVAPGTYTGPGNRDIDFLGKAITVRSQSGPDNCIIDCNGTEEDLHRGFSFHSSEEQNSVLDGFTITNGCAHKGGAIKCDYSSPTIINCIIQNNISAYIYDVNGTPGPIMILQDGGGIYCYESSPIINKCCFIENTASAGGGAISSGDGNAQVDSCVFIGNRAAISGGAIQLFGLYGDNMSIHNCIFTGNSAGGFDYYSSGQGGAICCSMKDTPTIGGCTITGNRAVRYGGGIYYCGSQVTNCIIWENWPDQLSGKSPIVTYSDVQGGYPGLGNTGIDPCFVEPGYWDDNGTPADANDDFWLDGDYHLKSAGWRWDTQRKVWTWDDVTSRCIDASNPGSPLGDELISIPDDPNNEWGHNLRIDMGAFGGTAQASIPPYDWALLADLTNDGIVTLEDFAYQAADWLNSADDQPGDLNRDGLIDINDLTLLTDDWLTQTSWH